MFLKLYRFIHTKCQVCGFITFVMLTMALLMSVHYMCLFFFWQWIRIYLNRSSLIKFKSWKLWIDPLIISTLHFSMQYIILHAYSNLIKRCKVAASVMSEQELVSVDLFLVGYYDKLGWFFLFFIQLVLCYAYRLVMRRTIFIQVCEFMSSPSRMNPSTSKFIPPLPKVDSYSLTILKQYNYFRIVDFWIQIIFFIKFYPIFIVDILSFF